METEQYCLKIEIHWEQVLGGVKEQNWWNNECKKVKLDFDAQ